LLKKATACFDKLSMSGFFIRNHWNFPLTLSLSKGVRRVFQQPASAGVLPVAAIPRA
jgi:hypothetical protein